MAEAKIITDKAPHTSKIKSITQGKDWEGGDKLIRTEYKVEFSNGHLPVFNIKASKDNPNREFPYKTGDSISYTLTEKEQYNKIRQYATLNMTKTHNTTNPPIPNQNTPLTQQQSIALSVALKLAKETFDSDLWQSYNKIEIKGKTKVETEEKTIEAIKKAKNEALSEIGQLTIVYYNTLTNKPQTTNNNER